MGHTDMKQSNQSTNGDSAAGFQARSLQAKESTAPVGFATVAKGEADGKLPSSLSASMWSTDGLVSSSSRLFQRSNSTPPTKMHVPERGNLNVFGQANGSYNLTNFVLGETDENNQDEDAIEISRPDLVVPLGQQIQRSWSAPPVPENYHEYFKPTSTMPTISEASRRHWYDGPSSSFNVVKKASVATVSPQSSPSVDREDRAAATSFSSSFRHGRFQSLDKAPEFRSQTMTLVDRVQEDFPRTPSPVLGFGEGPIRVPHREDFNVAGAMKNLRLDGSARIAPMGYDRRQGDRRVEHAPSVFNIRAAEYRPPHRAAEQFYLSAHPVLAPPGFQGPRPHGVYGNPSFSGQAHWVAHEGFPRHITGGHGPHHEFDHDPRQFPAHTKAQRYSKYGGEAAYGHMDSYGRQPTAVVYDIPPHQLYAPEPVMIQRSKSGPTRGYDTHLHPSHTYSATSLLEEFKSGAKADKWDLRTIQGYLAEFARDQAGSRFIQQKLEKADEHARNEAFNEIFPQALSLMADVFGNYVIQKLFDHGSPEQHRRLVGLMKNNMVTLALQVYGCRVIQKALEVTQVGEQLTLIQEMRGHVMKCVVDQNGNHVLQKCIEAASSQKDMAVSSDCVDGTDIQFIVDDFNGHAAALSMHAYGCRVIQRVLEHCSPKQIRPIVHEIVSKCRELVKDQFGNYVVQHVICHGELDQRNAVMKVILPEVAKWSQHKYASNVVEACLDVATSDEIHQIVNLILDCDESGASCALLPMMKHMYGNYVVQKLLDCADRHDRPRIVRIIQHNADYLKRFTYGKHVLSRLEREGYRNKNPFQ